MDDETIDLPLAPKKPYVRPQLHELTGSGADGKTFGSVVERTFVGPS
jgi:hypothetical protein